MKDNVLRRDFVKTSVAAAAAVAVGIMGSGQYTIPEGFAAVKLVKAGWRTMERWTRDFERSAFLEKLQHARKSLGTQTD
jgi:hypothetical protein